MLLCTIASPFLYWLGVPTVVVLVYFICCTFMVVFQLFVSLPESVCWVLCL